MNSEDIFNCDLKSINIDGIYIIGIDGLGGAAKSTISKKICKNFKETRCKMKLN